MVFTTFASDLLSCLLHLYSLVNLSKSIFSSSVYSGILDRSYCFDNTIASFCSHELRTQIKVLGVTNSAPRKKSVIGADERKLTQL